MIEPTVASCDESMTWTTEQLKIVAGVLMKIKPRTIFPAQPVVTATIGLEQMELQIFGGPARSTKPAELRTEDGAQPAG